MDDPSSVRAKALDLQERFIDRLASLRGNQSENELVEYKDMTRVLLGLRPRFKYHPLDRDTKEIRIVVLQPSTDHDAEPVCDIYHAPLDSMDFEYFALSYVWGDPNDTRPIKLDDQTIRVTANLEIALRHVRHTENPVPFWIDAICINQEDVEERNYQVGQMREIYQRAVLVLAWIGPQLSDREEKAFKLVLQVAELFAKDHAVVTDETSTWMAESVSSEFHDCSWLPLLELLERPWFSRVWVVQEVVVSKKVALHCGALRMSHYDFTFALLAVSAYLTTIAEAAGRDISDADHVTQPERIHELNKIHDRFGEAVYHVKMIHQSQLQNQKRMPPPESFYGIVRQYSNKQATDPRDKIFALLGLADESHKEVLSIIPNYADQPRDIFLSVIRLHIETHQNVDPLFECCGPDRPDEFPSWLPHWKPRYNPNVMRSLQIKGKIEFKASGESKPLINSSSDPLALNLKGILVDRIKAVGAQYEARPGEMIGDEPYMPDAVRQSWSDMIGIGDLFRYAGQFNRMSESEKAEASSDYLTGDMTKYAAFMRIMVMNPQSDYEIDYWSSGGDKKIKSAPKLDKDGLSRQRVSARSGRCCLNRRFFVTEKGYMGLSSPEICVGDMICIFPGLELPFIVRHECKPFVLVGMDMEPIFRSDYESFLLVGEAYIQGLMNGEAMEGVDAGSAHLRDIELR